MPEVKLRDVARNIALRREGVNADSLPDEAVEAVSSKRAVLP
jgi:hypothetical protein